MTEEKSVLRWGGLAGMLIPIFTILTAVTLFGFVPSAPAGPPRTGHDARAAFVVGESFSLVNIVLGGSARAFWAGRFLQQRRSRGLSSVRSPTFIMLLVRVRGIAGVAT